jgi:hypothetical protein
VGGGGGGGGEGGSGVGVGGGTGAGADTLKKQPLHPAALCVDLARSQVRPALVRTLAVLFWARTGWGALAAGAGAALTHQLLQPDPELLEMARSLFLNCLRASYWNQVRLLRSVVLPPTGTRSGCPQLPAPRNPSNTAALRH